MPRQHALSLLTYLRDGHFLDRYTLKLTAVLAIYNPLLRVYGYYRMVITRGNDGLFNGRIWIMAASTWALQDKGAAHKLALDVAILLLGGVHAFLLVKHWLPSVVAFLQVRALAGPLTLHSTQPAPLSHP